MSGPLNYDSRPMFRIMACTFSLCQAALTTAMMSSSIALGDHLGSTTNAMLYAVSLVSSLSIAPWVNNSLTPKRGLLLGFVCCTLYLLCFSVLTCRGLTFLVPTYWRQVVALVGAIFGGLGISITWTGQGLFFSLVVQELTETERIEKMAMAVAADEDSFALERWTSKLSSSFAVWIMSTECAVKIQFSVMQVFLPDAEWLYFVLPALSLFATLCFSLTPELRALNKNPMSTCSKAIATVKLWPDLTLWLISLTNVAFGLSAAWVNSHVNAHLLLEAFADPKYVGFASGMTTAIAGVTSRMTGCTAKKGPFMALGSIAFLLLGLLSKIPSNWMANGAWILVFYVLHGIGRGVFESTNKAVFGQNFPKEKGLGAFANLLVQTTLAAVAGHLLSAHGLEDLVTYMLIACASLILPGFFLASFLQRKRWRAVTSLSVTAQISAV